MPVEDVSRVRGEADSMALKLRHHDRKTHLRRVPRGEAARAIFEAVEQVCVEALGVGEGRAGRDGAGDEVTAGHGDTSSSSRRRARPRTRWVFAVACSTPSISAIAGTGRSWP